MQGTSIRRRLISLLLVMVAGMGFGGAPVYADVGARGDMNCNGVLDAFDVDPFVLALIDPDEYANQYPDCDWMNADINCDGVVDSFDIDQFVLCLIAGGCDPFHCANSWATFIPPGAEGGYMGVVTDGRYVYFVPHGDAGGSQRQVLRYDTWGDFDDPTSWETFNPEGVGICTGGYVGGVFDGRYVYFVPYQTPGCEPTYGEILRYDIAGDFADPASWATCDPGDELGVGTDPDGYMGAVYDGFRYIHLVPHCAGDTCCSGEVLRYDTWGDFWDAAAWDAFDPGANGVGTDPDGYIGAVFDGRYVYFVPFSNRSSSHHGEVLRYDTWGDFYDASSWQTFDPGAAYFDALGYDPDGYISAVFDGWRYIYFVPNRNQAVANAFFGEVLRLDTWADFSDPASWDLYDPGDDGDVGTDPDGYAGAVFDGRYVYFVPYHNGSDYHGEVLRYDTWGDFYDPSSWTTFDPGEHGVGSDPDGYWGAVIVNGYIYFSPYHNGTGLHAEVMRYWLGAGN